MVLTIKRRFGIYKRFEKDIWGLSFSNFSKTDKLTNFFFKLYLNKEDSRYNKIRRYIYRIDIVNPKRKKKFMKFRFITLRLIKLFYLTLKYKQFRTYAQIASKKDGFFQSNYCFYIENRLVSFLYRTNFIISMFEIIEYIKKGKILVNGNVVNYVNANVKIGDIVSFKTNNLIQLRLNFIKRFRNKGFIFNTPRYLFISYKLFFAFTERQPLDSDLAFPIKLDMYRATGYY